MATINLSNEIKNKFKLFKLEFQANKGRSFSENEFVEILLDYFKKYGGNNN